MRATACACLLVAARALALAPPGRTKLPLMPFGSDELLMPGQSRYLHLYEARFLALFEHASTHCDSNVVLGFFAGDNALLRCATRARIDAWERLDVGVGATVRGVGRCAIAGVDGGGETPYLVADLEPLEDADADAGGAAAEAVAALADEVDALAARHDIAKNVAGEIRVDPRAMGAPEDGGGGAADDGPVTRRVARLSEEARPGDATHAELLSFLALEGAEPAVKLKMFASTSREERLGAARAELERQKAELAAKASLKSLNLSWGDDD